MLIRVSAPASADPDGFQEFRLQEQQPVVGDMGVVVGGVACYRRGRGLLTEGGHVEYLLDVQPQLLGLAAGNTGAELAVIESVSAPSVVSPSVRPQSPPPPLPRTMPVIPPSADEPSQPTGWPAGEGESLWISAHILSPLCFLPAVASANPILPPRRCADRGPLICFSAGCKPT